MKFLVLSACVAVSSAQLVAYSNGAVVPADTLEVQAARAAHAAAGGAVNPEGLYGYAAGYGYGYPSYAGGYFGGLIGHANGAVVPVDTPEVYAAKAAHAAAGGAVHAAPFAYAAGYGYPGYAGGYFGGLIGHANGAVVPVDTPEVYAAKAAHAAAGGAVHAAPFAGYGYAAGYPAGYGYAAGYPAGFGYAPVHAGFAGLVAHPNGAVVPLEPADVVAARAEHLAAVAAA
jgi:hypothetical protein